ncbi:MAG: hypothetical protein US36_C0011G0006 [Candidatus Wolfebacteria bacterium GW2011_GWC1_37_10]|uniref:Uncharacterized protein n=1 Tax=Candidatus Wolfebacteria bacterium GW2011_GWC1_37_10 TaxID=1619010 RepID=A0A0G0G7B0_9BACT|nr:MAG: hypothetical protein US36_C0011G0006 [Candidatus Wolfebacteria bacterium GW2011_GWC1_37_10]
MMPLQKNIVAGTITENKEVAMNNGIFPACEEEKDAPVQATKGSIIHLKVDEVCDKDDCDYEKDCRGRDPERDAAFVCDVESISKT